MTALNEIYNTKLLELAANIPCSVRLVHPDATASAHSKLCGSTIEIDLSLRDGKVSEYGQTVKACLLGQSAAAIMGHNIIGTSPAQLREVGRVMRDLLKADGPPPQGRWADLALLAPVRDYKARHTSTLLVFDAVEKALAEIEAAAAGAEPLQAEENADADHS